MNIDARGNKHASAGAPGGGQFAGHVRSAPTHNLEVEQPTSPSEARVLIQAFERESEAAWERVRALRAPAVATATALVREKYPDAESIHLHEDNDEDTMEPYVVVENIVTRHGEYLELDADDEEQLNGIFRAVADTSHDLAQLPTAYQVPGTSTYVVRVPVVEPDDGSPAEQAFFAAIERDVYDNDLAAAALRSAAARLQPDAEALLFETNYSDEGSTLSLAGLRVAGIDSEVDPLHTPGYEDLDQIVFQMSGAGNTGQEISGFRHLKGDSYIFDLKGGNA
jgi:hypothetical protein